MDHSGYLLLIEDDPRIQANNKKILEREGYSLKQAFTLREARMCIADEAPRAIVLDAQLPDGNGFDFLYEIRQSSTVPVLMLTAMDTPEDMVKGLKSGSDIYLTKPYHLEIFFSHLEALLRRSALIPDTLAFGPFKLVPASNTAYLHGDILLLAQKEFTLLQVFVQRPEETLCAEYLYNKVWGLDMAGDENALRTVISRLRKKLADSGYTITAERNEGYIFERV